MEQKESQIPPLLPLLLLLSFSVTDCDTAPNSQGLPPAIATSKPSIELTLTSPPETLKTPETPKIVWGVYGNNYSGPYNTCSLGPDGQGYPIYDNPNGVCSAQCPADFVKVDRLPSNTGLVVERGSCYPFHPQSSQPPTPPEQQPPQTQKLKTPTPALQASLIPTPTKQPQPIKATPTPQSLSATETSEKHQSMPNWLKIWALAAGAITSFMLRWPQNALKFSKQVREYYNSNNKSLPFFLLILTIFGPGLAITALSNSLPPDLMLCPPFIPTALIFISLLKKIKQLKK